MKRAVARHRAWASLSASAAALLSALGGIAAQPAQATASFDYVSYLARDTPVPSPGRYRNPVVPGFSPDPSVVRVGEDFYLVTSTFSWFPGLPIYHSRDLVNWRQIGNAIDRPGQARFVGLGVNRGLFAPTIHHEGGRFYILNTCIDCGGNFIISADRPEGPWSDPVWLPFGGIDPSLFVDRDGQAYIVYNDAPPGPPEYEGHRALWLRPFDLVNGRLTGQPVLLVDKGVNPADRPIWAEGPHIYLHNGRYYLVPAEGGTADQHAQTVYAADRVTGPFRPGPVNPILTQRDLPRDRPDRVEATGHADLVQLPDGRWFALFLATRPFRDQFTMLGRETFLLPVDWSSGWPVILPRRQAMPLEMPTPRAGTIQQRFGERWIENFDRPLAAGALPGAQWLRLRGGDAAPWLQVAQGALRLHPQAAPGSLQVPAFAGVRLRHPVADFSTRVRFSADAHNVRAGLLAVADEQHFLFFGPQLTGRGTELVVRQRAAAADTDHGRQVFAMPLASRQMRGGIDLRLRITNDRVQPQWRQAGDGAWQPLGPAIAGDDLSSVRAGLFSGLVVGPHISRTGE